MKNLNHTNARFELGENNGQSAAGRVRSLAARMLVVFVTLALVLGSSPFAQLAYAGDEDGIVLASEEPSIEGQAEQATGGSDEQTNDDATVDEPADGTAEEEASDGEAADGSEDGDAAAESSEDELASVDEGIALASASDTLVDGQYGNYTYKKNTTKDAFTSSEYSAYRDANATQQLGVAGSFHITAFNQMTIQSHVYGNVLTKKMVGSNNFGMDDRTSIYGFTGLSYIQDYPNPTGNADGYDKSSNGILVVGSGNTVTVGGNNDQLYINDRKLDSPYTLIQDADTATSPFIDIDAVKASSVETQAALARRSDIGATTTTKNDGKVRTITISDGYTGCAYVNLTASELQSSYENVYIDNLSFESNSGLVINVDCQGASSVDVPKTHLRVNGKEVSTEEIDKVYGNTGYVLYNFYNTADDLPITVHECTASVLAPNASLTLGPGSACGTFIANNVTVVAESHIRPFHGTTNPDDGGDDQDETTAVAVSKQWLDAEGNAEQGVSHSAVTAELWYADENGNATTPVTDSDGNTRMVELSAEGEWAGTFSDLPVKDASGNALRYTVKESEASQQANPDYSSSVVEGENGLVITNRHNEEEVSFSLCGYSMAAESGEVSEPDKVCYVDPKVVKVLEGRALKAGEFSFQLVSETGAVVSTATNDEAGMVDFDKAADVSGNPENPSCLSFTSAGTYTYTVRETADYTRDSSIEYSTEVVKFVTTIGQNSDGSLYEKESHYVKYANAADAAAGVNGTTYASSEHPTITNKVKTLSLALTKTDSETGVGLEGAVYGLYRVDESVEGGAVRVMTATSDANGLMVFTATDATAITTGQSYYFQEVSAPEGYTVSENRTAIFQIVQNADGTYSIVSEDDAAVLSDEADDAATGHSGSTLDPIVYGKGVSDSQVQVTITKVSSDGSALTGAELAVRDEDGNDVASWTTEAAGYVVKGLVSGKKYVLYEKAAPEGYSKAAEVTFTVDEYGKVTIEDGSKSGDLTNAYSDGSELSLVDYKLDVNESTVVKVREEGKPSGKGGNKNGRLPQTGELATYAGIVLAAGACLVAGGLARKARRKM